MISNILPKLLTFAAIAAVGVGCFAPPSYAQQTVPDALTGTASPGLVERQFEDRTPSLRTLPNIEVTEFAIAGAPEGADQVALTLRNLEIEGAKAYTQAQLRPLYAASLNQDITLADVYIIAADITRKYRNDGYLLTQVVVPPQTIENGIVRLRIVEGYVDQVEIRVADERTRSLISAYTDLVRGDGGQALNIVDLERALLLINDLPGVDARTILNPSPTQAGAADMIVISERKLYDALLSVDNYGTRFLGPVQLTAAGSLNSALGFNERITAQFVMSPNSIAIEPELYYFSLNYEQPISDAGSTLSIYGSHTKTYPGYTLEEFDAQGRSRLYGLEIAHPFIRSRNFNLTCSIGFEARNVESQNNIETFTRKDRIRAFRFGSRVEYLDTSWGVAYNTADLTLSKGIGLFDATQGSDINVTRVGADSDFFKAELDLQRLQRLTSNVNLLLTAQGQWANDRLLSSEEFSLGGFGMGRGFSSSEVIGDRGIAGMVELQWNDPVSWQDFDGTQLYGFYDLGRVWNIDPLTNSQKRDTLASAGVGFRLDFTPTLKSNFTLAFPLNRDVQTQGDDDPRAYFSVSKTF
jgi:hemolysin activation/secretion protein